MTEGKESAISCGFLEGIDSKAFVLSSVLDTLADLSEVSERRNGAIELCFSRGDDLSVSVTRDTLESGEPELRLSVTERFGNASLVEVFVFGAGGSGSHTIAGLKYAPRKGTLRLRHRDGDKLTYGGAPSSDAVGELTLRLAGKLAQSVARPN